MADSPLKTCRDLELLHPFVKVQALKVLEKCKAEGLNVDVFETLRTLERQKWLKANGKSSTLSSYHRLALAVDFVFKTVKGNWVWNRPKEDWDKLANIMEEFGFFPGWRWKSLKDGPHAQMQFTGLRSTSLYKKLDELGGELSPEFFSYIDTLIAKDSKLSKLLPKPKVKAKKQPELLVESEPVIELVAEKAKVSVEITDKPHGVFDWLISLITSPFGKN